MIPYILFTCSFFVSIFFRQFRSNILWIFTSTVFVLFLSFRNEPDEYFRYMQNSISTINEFFSLSFFSEPLYQSLCLLLKELFPPFFALKLLYIISYLLPLLAIYFHSFNCGASFRKRSLSLNITSLYYFSHSFLVLCYTGIRSSFALGFLLLALWFYRKSRYALFNISLLLTILTHVQFIPVCLVIYGIAYRDTLLYPLQIISRINIFRTYKYLSLAIFFAILLPLIFLFVVPIISSYLPSLLQSFGTYHINYLDSASYGYQLNIFDLRYLSNLLSPILLFLIIFYRNKYFDELPIFSLLPLIGVVISICFSSYAIFAYRISFTFYSLFLYLLPSSFLYIGKYRRLLIIMYSLSLLFYNVFIAERLNSFSY